MLTSIVWFVFLALSIASVYLLISIGLSIVFGSLKFVNMAHGALFLLGGYIGLIIAFERNYGGALSRFDDLGLGLGVFWALILVPIVVFVAGVVMERLMAKPLYERDLLDQLLITFGVLIIFQELINILFGATNQNYRTPDWASGAFTLPGIGTPPGMAAASTWRVYIIGITIAFTVFILLFFKYTNYGLTVRAGTEDSEMTSMLGIRTGRPFLLIFAIGAAYAGLAGFLTGSIFQIDPFDGMVYIIPALVIVIMGGVGSIKGTIVAALLAGLVFAAFDSDPTGTFDGAARASIYLLAIIVLALRPSGIYPTAEIE